MQPVTLAVLLCSLVAACTSVPVIPEPALAATRLQSEGQTVRDPVAPVRIVDGDTLVMDGRTHRLFGIDSPEASQQCRRKDQSVWPCGRLATEFLTRLIQGQPLDCREVPQTRDRYGRQISLCSTGDIDVNRQMVASGHAWAYRRYSTRYIAAERQAKRQGLGVWQGSAEPPWHVRQARSRTGSRKPAAEQSRSSAAVASGSADCLIKGNVSSGGKIFHLPGSRDYDKTTVNTSRGERWFCTAEEARSAGWRARR